MRAADDQPTAIFRQSVSAHGNRSYEQPVHQQSVCAIDLAGAKATGANIHRLGRTADNSLNSSDIRLERSVFLAVRVRNGATERNALSAYTALCHVTDTSCDLRLS